MPRTGSTRQDPVVVVRETALTSAVAQAWEAPPAGDADITGFPDKFVVDELFKATMLVAEGELQAMKQVIKDIVEEKYRRYKNSAELVNVYSMASDVTRQKELLTLMEEMVKEFERSAKTSDQIAEMLPLAACKNKAFLTKLDRKSVV